MGLLSIATLSDATFADYETLNKLMSNDSYLYTLRSRMSIRDGAKLIHRSDSDDLYKPRIQSGVFKFVSVTSSKAYTVHLIHPSNTVPHPVVTIADNANTRAWISKVGHSSFVVNIVPLTKGAQTGLVFWHATTVDTVAN